MKKIPLMAVTFVVCLCLSGFPLMAQGRGGHAGGGMGGPGTGGGPEVGNPGTGHGSDMGNGPMGDHGPGANNPAGAGNTTRGNTNSTMGGRKTPDQLLAQNTKLSSKLQPLLPAGTNMQSAASGFKNLGQFVAAVHVAHNLGIPFDQLKSKMMNGDSLGKAIESLNPNINHKQAKSDAKNAEHQAKQDIHESKS